MMYSSFKLIIISKNREQVNFGRVVGLICCFEDISISITPIDLSCKITYVYKNLIFSSPKKFWVGSHETEKIQFTAKNS